MAVGEKSFRNGQGRVFAQWNGAGPNHVVEYQGLARLTGLSESLGDVTPIRAPSRSQYSKFDVVDYVRGEPGLPTTSMVARFTYVNKILTQVCPFDVDVHYGQCKNPSDYINGWDKAVKFEKALITTRTSDDLSILEGTEAVITFTGEITALKFWEYDKMTLGVKAAGLVDDEVIDVLVSDYISCGECGYESDGNKRIFALVQSSGASVGLMNQVIYSTDGGSNWTEEDVDTLAVGETASGMAVVGENLVVVSGLVASLSYAGLVDLGSWTEVTTGFVADKFPNAIFSVASTLTWIVGEDGYIYFTEDPSGGVTVQADGSASTEDLLCIHGIDSRSLIAGGETGLLLTTNNGGAVWSVASSVPAGMGTIQAVWMRSEFCWIIAGIVGGAGTLWYTINGGVSWSQINLPVAAITEVTDITFADHADSPFGFLTLNTASAGYLLRTIDGGKTWYTLPDGAGSMPSNAKLNSVSSGVSSSFVVAGGLMPAASTDGIIIQGQ